MPNSAAPVIAVSAQSSPVVSSIIPPSNNPTKGHLRHAFKEYVHYIIVRMRPIPKAKSALTPEQWQAELRERYRKWSRSDTFKQWIANNREDQNKKATLRRKALREYGIVKLGGKCLVCGSSVKLEFHHPKRRKQPNQKPFPSHVTRRDIDGGKVVLVCMLCHRAITRLVYWTKIDALQKAIDMM